MLEPVARVKDHNVAEALDRREEGARAGAEDDLTGLDRRFAHPHPEGVPVVRLAAKLLYGELATRDHWALIERVFLSENWAKPDHGLREEKTRHQYTASKVVAACGLEFIAEYSDDAAVAGDEAVDVSAALFPVWAYTELDAPEMQATDGGA